MIHKIFIYLIIISVLTLFAGQQAFCESEREEKTFGNYRVRTHFNHKTRWGKLEILKKGRRIYRQQAKRNFLFFQENDDDIGHTDFIKNNKIHPKDAYEPVAIGRDITGRGIPNLIISEWTGGMKCCVKIYVFELGEKIKTAAVLGGIGVDFSHFADLDGDSVLEFITFDWTFACWNTSCANSPVPDIILRFDKGKYVIAEKFMRKPVPSAEELEAKVHEVQAEYSSELSEYTSKIPESHRACFPYEYPPALLWKTMLDLIYTGNMDLAWKFFDKAWDKSFKEKKKFLREFREQLQTSPYWSQIKKMNAR